MKNWIRKKLGLKVRFYGELLPHDFRKACPGNACGVYYQDKHGNYWFKCDGIAVRVTETDYLRGSWLKAIFEEGENL